MAAAEIDELLKADRSLKMIFVPYPILSAQSVEGGRVELALREIGPDKFLEFRRRIYATRGTIDGASVHPREVVRQALRHNAAAIIFAHNHPSGVAEASQADELITRRLKDALALVDIRVLDHLIVGDNNCLSFAERGLL